MEIPCVGIFVWVTVGFPEPGTMPSTGLAPSSVSFMHYDDAYKHIWDAAPPTPRLSSRERAALSCGSSSVK